ncbi:MAG: hypothetical protein AAFY48_20410 [Bacteroidota bacterium]
MDAYSKGVARYVTTIRIGETSDIAELAYSIATSTFITGETINVDGGHVAGHAFG